MCRVPMAYSRSVDQPRLSLGQFIGQRYGLWQKALAGLRRMLAVECGHVVSGEIAERQ